MRRVCPYGVTVCLVLFLVACHKDVGKELTVKHSHAPTTESVMDTAHQVSRDHFKKRAQVAKWPVKEVDRLISAHEWTYQCAKKRLLPILDTPSGTKEKVDMVHAKLLHAKKDCAHELLASVHLHAGANSAHELTYILRHLEILDDRTIMPDYVSIP